MDQIHLSSAPGKVLGVHLGLAGFHRNRLRSGYGDTGLLQFEGKRWNDHVSREQGNFDFIMGSDVDFTVPEVVQELYSWGRWYARTASISAFRLMR